LLPRFEDMKAGGLLIISTLSAISLTEIMEMFKPFTANSRQKGWCKFVIALKHPPKCIY